MVAANFIIETLKNILYDDFIRELEILYENDCISTIQVIKAFHLLQVVMVVN